MARVTPKRSPCLSTFTIASLLSSTTPPRSRRTNLLLEHKISSRADTEPKKDWFEQMLELVESNSSLEHKILRDPSDSMKWLEITSTKCLIDQQLGPVKPARLVVSTTKTYKVDVMFPIPRTVERLKGFITDDYASILSLMDESGGYVLCPGLQPEFYEEQFKAAGYKREGIVDFQLPVKRYEAANCLLWHKPSNRFAKLRHLFNVCSKCKDEGHRAVQNAKRNLGASEEVKDIRLNPTSNYPISKLSPNGQSIKVKRLKNELRVNKEKLEKLLQESSRKREAPTQHIEQDLPGVDVIGRTTFIVTNAADTFNWTEYGFKLTVPPNSLPAGVDQCQLDIIASTAGDYQFPDDHHLVSGVFWVRPSAPGRFRQQLTMEIQHCAKMTSSTKLSFVRARCSQERLPYRFRQVEGGDSFPENRWYGSLKVTHFSGLAVVGKGAKIDYTASFYYLTPDSPPPTIEIYFTICKDTKVHNKEWKRHFDELGAKRETIFHVEFLEPSISLDIDFDKGVTVEKWHLLPDTPLRISKEAVDSFKKGRTLPFKRLVATLSESNRDSKVPRCSLVTKLLGAKEPDNRVRIFLGPVNKEKTTLDQKIDKGLIIKDLHTVNSALHTAADVWINLGFELGLDSDRLDEISSHKNGDKDNIRDMLKYWLQTSPSRTWTDICNALREKMVARNVLADAIEREYCSGGRKREATQHNEQGDLVPESPFLGSCQSPRSRARPPHMARFGPTPIASRTRKAGNFFAPLN